MAHLQQQMEYLPLGPAGPVDEMRKNCQKKLLHHCLMYWQDIVAPECQTRVVKLTRFLDQKLTRFPDQDILQIASENDFTPSLRDCLKITVGELDRISGEDTMWAPVRHKIAGFSVGVMKRMEFVNGVWEFAVIFEVRSLDLILLH